MRILLATGELTYSNGTTYALDLARALRSRDHEIQVASLGGVFFREMETLIPASQIMTGDHFSFRRLLRIFKEFQPEVVHSTGHGALTIAYDIASRQQAPLLHTVHSWLPEERARTLPEDLAAVIVPNQDLRELLVNESGVPKSLIHVIPYGVDGELHRPRRTESAVPPAALTSLPGSPRTAIRPVAGVIGRLDVGRRHDVFLDAAKIVHESAPEMLFLIAGEGADESRLRKRVLDLRLHECVTFVQPYARTCDIHLMLDVLVVVSDRGGVGLNLLEGMAHERAIIATGGGEVFSILNDDNLGVLVPQNQPAALAEAILALSRNPARRAELGRNARTHALAEYPIEQHITSLENLYWMQTRRESGEIVNSE